MADRHGPYLEPLQRGLPFSHYLDWHCEITLGVPFLSELIYLFSLIFLKRR